MTGIPGMYYLNRDTHQEMGIRVWVYRDSKSNATQPQFTVLFEHELPFVGLNPEMLLPTDSSAVWANHMTYARQHKDIS